MGCDISIIITAHHEGRLAHHTMCSVLRSVGHANRNGLETEIIVVMDRPDEKTQKYFKRYIDPAIKIHRADYGDPGLSRNDGINLSTGKYISFLDADDLFGKRWLEAAYYEAEKNQELCIYHPEYIIVFGAENYIIRQKSSDDEKLNLGNMIEYNCWNSIHFLTQRSILLENPFEPTPLDSGFGYEDWHWNCEMIARNIAIKVVPDTCVFYRKKSAGSRLSDHDRDYVTIRPTKLFDPAMFRSIIEKSGKIDGAKVV